MKIKACICTDVGQSRKVNQDAALIKVANTREYGRISLVAVCDGMGGLSKGEIASCKVIRALESWFQEELPLFLNMEINTLWKQIEGSLRRLIIRSSGDLRRYGKHRGIKLGTTVAALLQIGSRYMLLNVGDSRIYAVEKASVKQLTKDQSVVQDKLDRGLITEDEIEGEQQKNVLLQCIGTSSVPEPEIRMGELRGDTTIVACTDGFWRTLDNEVMRMKLCPQMCLTDEDMLTECRKLVDRAMEADEEDNISVAALCFEM